MNQKNVFMGGYSITNVDPKDGNHGTFQANSTFIIQSPFHNGQFFCSLMQIKHNAILHLQYRQLQIMQRLGFDSLRKQPTFCDSNTEANLIKLLQL